MSRYYTNSLLIFSVFGGVVTFFLILSFEDVALSLFCGAITALLLSIIIPTVFAIGDRKFMPLKKEIAEPIVLDERVRYPRTVQKQNQAVVHFLWWSPLSNCF